MDFDFNDRQLIDLYTKGRAKKLKLSKGIVRKFIERVNRIEAAYNINDLRSPASMHFEKLQGYENRFSIRLNIEYRLEFEIEFYDNERKRGKVIILCISNHYKK